MLTKNRWLVSNLEGVNKGKCDQFTVKLHPYVFDEMTFMDAAAYTARLIQSQHSDLHIGLSGGADSEFIVRLFHMLNIPFTVVHVKFTGSQDNFLVDNLCSELGLKKIVNIWVDEETIYKYWIKNLYFKLNSDGLNHTFQMMVVDKVKEREGTCILGETHIYDPDPMKSIVRAFKFLPDFHSKNVIPFYYYTLELTYAEMKQVRPGETAQQFKARVRGTPLRKHKSYPQFSKETMKWYNNWIERLNPEKLMHDMGTPQDFLNTMKGYVR